MINQPWTVLILLIGALAVAPPSPATDRNQSLIAALEKLRAEGLNIVYSSALISRDLRAPIESNLAEFNALSLVERARRLLSAHELDLREVSAGKFVVVRGKHERHSVNPIEAQAAAAAAPQQAVAELPALTVFASRYEIDQQPTLISSELTGQSIDALPGLNQDVQRAVQHLPGTTSAPLSARTHVRGGREDELTVYFDGVAFDNPFHFRDFPGPKGLLDPASVSSLELYSGVLPVRYGNALSGVVELEPRRWDGENHHEIGTSLLYSHALSQGRLANERVEWLAAVRHSTYKGAFDIADPGLGNPVLRDAMGRLQMDAGEHTRFTLGWLSLDDQLAPGLANDDGNAHARYRDHTAWLAWRQSGSPEIVLNTSVSARHATSERYGLVARNISSTLNEEKVVDTLTVRTELSLPLTLAVRGNFGMEWTDDSAQYNEYSGPHYYPTQPPASPLTDLLGRESDLERRTSFKRTRAALAMYGSIHWQLSERIAADFGSRLDGHDGGSTSRHAQFAPRASAEYRANDRTIMRAALGVQTQAQRPADLHAADGETELQGIERAQQVVLSIEQGLSDTVDLRVEGYAKRVLSPAPYYENLFDPVSVAPEIEVDRIRVAPDRSTMHGAEMSLRLALPERWSGWFQYVWSSAQDEIDGRRIPRTWSARHAINAGVSWNRLPWQLTASSNWHTGWRTTRLLESVTQPGALALGDRNADRWPDWFSLDLRASWNGRVRFGTLRLLAELTNTTGSATLCCSEYGFTRIDSAGEMERPRPIRLPRNPFVGVTWEMP